MLENADPLETGCLDWQTLREIIIGLNIIPDVKSFGELFNKYKYTDPKTDEVLVKYARIPHDMLAAEERHRRAPTSLILRKNEQEQTETRVERMTISHPC
jgi:hypothetical protein